RARQGEGGLPAGLREGIHQGLPADHPPPRPSADRGAVQRFGLPGCGWKRARCFRRRPRRHGAEAGGGRDCRAERQGPRAAGRAGEVPETDRRARAEDDRAQEGDRGAQEGGGQGMIDAASSVAEALDAGEADPRGYARAILNILEDASFERAQLEATQRAVMNILDDAAAEKKKVEQANVDLRSENTERARAERALRRATAAAEAANKELEAFSYSVAHDLRAPLRSIAGFSQALQEDHSDILDEEATRFLRHIREAAQQMGELIDDLLNLSRVTRAELRRENVDLSEIGRAVIRRLQEA